MKKSILLLSIYSLLCTIGSSCGSGADTPPTFDFKTGAGYTRTDVTVSNASVKIGISATKARAKLETFEVSHLDLNGVSHSDTVMTLTTDQQKKFEYDYIIDPPNPYATGVEKWTFKITDRSSNSVTRNISITYN